MSRDKTWDGFDYANAKPITKTRSEWRQMIAAARRTVRAGGDLLLFDDENDLAFEVYDKDVA